MLNSVKKILFVVDTLAQHGAERYLYEILKVLKNDGWEIAIYSVVKLEVVHRYYIEHFENLGITVYEEQKYYYKPRNYYLRRFFSKRYEILNKLIIERREEELLKKLNLYDVVSIIKWEVYKSKNVLFDKILHKKIHILSTLIQYQTNPYLNLPTTKTDFILMHPEQQNQILKNTLDYSKYKFYHIPLIIENKNWENKYNPSSDGILKLGIFARINPDQPTIFSLFIVHELKSRNIPVMLYFFGRVYNEDFFKYYQKTIEILKIKDQVKFIGHTEDLGQAIKDNNLDLGIMSSLNNLVGYSSIELQSHGLPVLFYNISDSGFESEFPFIRNTVSEMCEEIIELWQKKDGLKYLSDHTFLWAKEEYGIHKNHEKIKIAFDYNSD